MDCGGLYHPRMLYKENEMESRTLNPKLYNTRVCRVWGEVGKDKLSSGNMVVSQDRGGKYRPPSKVTLVLGTPPPPIFLSLLVAEGHLHR